MRLYRKVRRLFRKTKYTVKELIRVSHAIEGENSFSVLADLVRCRLRYGASPNNYLMFDMRHATAQERATYFTHTHYKRIERKYNQPDQVWKLKDKYAFAEILGDQYGRKYARSSDMTFAQFQEIASCGKVICKQLMGAQGKNIFVYTIDHNESDVYKEIQTLDECIVEEWIHQHEIMSSLYPGAVNPLRIQTLYVEDEVHILGATLTVANGTEIANASAPNSIFALIDVSDGHIQTDGFDYNGHEHLSHPTTHMVFRDFQIPYWSETVSLITETAKRFPDIRHIGWDVAIGLHGPVIIEANETPGYTAYQVYRLTKEHRGTLPLYRQFM